MEVTSEILGKVYGRRNLQAHKGNFGHLLIIGGNKQYTGSPAMNALAAYRAGVDLVTIAAPERAANIIASFSPNLITYPLQGQHLASEHISELFELLENKNAVVIGSGLGREKETFHAVLKFLRNVELPCVIDADAIHAISKHKDIIKENFVLTPHAKEFQALSGENILNGKLEDKIEAVRKFSLKFKATVLLKGNPDIICDKETALNYTGNAYMTKGGTGDTLAGIIGALLAQKAEPFLASCAAAYINGKAGDIVAKEKKQSLLATDIIEAIPKVFLEELPEI